MLLRRLAAAFAMSAAMSAVAAAQDVVHLKNGKVLSGSIVFEGDTKAGFMLRRWDTGGEIFVKWSQVPDSEAYRIRTRVAGPTSGAEAAAAELIDAVRIVTNAPRELIGVVLSEKDGVTQIKTVEGVQSTPKAAEVLREKVKVREDEVYTPDERIDRRAQGLAESDFEKLSQLAGFAASIKAFARAKDFYLRAEQAAPADRKEEFKGLAKGMEVRIVEDNAEKALAAIRKLAAEIEFDKAIEAANKFLSEFAESSVAKANGNIISEIEARRKDYRENRDKVLTRDVPEAFVKVRTSLLEKYSGTKFKLQDAREGAAKLDEEIAAEVGKRLKATPDEVITHWGKRTEKKIKTVSMKDGTWLHRGGQDGGMDYSGSGDEEMDEFKRRFGDGQDPKKKPQLGQKLETQAEWWQNASGSMRKEWLECLYADSSSQVKKEAIETDCRPCKGLGKMNTSRAGKKIEITCHECHGVKKVLTIKYW